MHDLSRSSEEVEDPKWDREDHQGQREHCEDGLFKQESEIKATPTGERVQAKGVVYLCTRGAVRFHCACPCGMVEQQDDSTRSGWYTRQPAMGPSMPFTPARRKPQALSRVLPSRMLLVLSRRGRARGTWRFCTAEFAEDNPLRWTSDIDPSPTPRNPGSLCFCQVEQEQEQEPF